MESYQIERFHDLFRYTSPKVDILFNKLTEIAATPIYQFITPPNPGPDLFNLFDRPIKADTLPNYAGEESDKNGCRVIFSYLNLNGDYEPFCSLLVTPDKVFIYDEDWQLLQIYLDKEPMFNSRNLSVMNEQLLSKMVTKLLDKLQATIV